jgi:hypothetical protein
MPNRVMAAARMSRRSVAAAANRKNAEQRNP